MSGIKYLIDFNKIPIYIDKYMDNDSTISIIRKDGKISSAIVSESLGNLLLSNIREKNINDILYTPDDNEIAIITNLRKLLINDGK